MTFSVTVHSPDTDNHLLASTVMSVSAGSNCAAGSADPRCTVTVPVAQLSIGGFWSAATATPGSVLGFTVTLANTGQVAYTGITVATDPSEVFANATSNGDQAATSGTIVVTATGASWTGSIPVGGTVTITGTVTVDNPDTGNKILGVVLSTAAAGSNCPPSGTDPACTITAHVLVPALSITQTADTVAAVPGQVVGYTLTISNTGTAPYAGAVVTELFAEMFDDAAYNGGALATAGALSYTSPVLTWTGDLAAGAAAVVTFSVTVHNPDTGDKQVVITAASAVAGSSCPPGTTSSPCQLVVGVLTPALTIVKTASTLTPVPGQQVICTITVANTGQTPYAGASLSDPLTGVLDDAVYNSDAAAVITGSGTSAGAVSYTGSAVSWTGDLAVAASVTITYSVTIDNPDTGDRILAGTVTSPAPGSNCPAGGTDPRCTVTVTVVSAATLTITATAGAASAVAGGVVSYTVTIANSGLSDYTGAAFTVPLGGVLGNAAYRNDAAAVITGTATSAGSVSYTSPDLGWAGTVPASGSVTLTYSVTVDNPDTGSQILASTVTSASTGSNCGDGSADPRCTATVTVSALIIDSTASTGTTTPGGVVGYTTTLANTGQTPYTGISVSFGGTPGDATGNGDQTASSGTLSVGATGAVWTGDIPVGATITLTGSVTVADPYPGGPVMALLLVSAAAGSNCPTGSTDPRCAPAVDVLIPGLSITQTASTASAVPGQVISYTLRITNTGTAPYTGAVVTDSFAEMSDDAAYNGDAAITTGTGALTYTSPALTWTGDLAPAAAAVITFTVTVNSPDTGDKLVITTVSSAAAGSSCPPGTTSGGCQLAVAVLTPALTITAAAAPVTATTATGVPVSPPSATVTYTITVADTGQTPYTGATVTDPLTGVLDDAAYNHDAATTTATTTGTAAGSVTYTEPDLTWTGNLNPGDTATVTFTVTVDSPDTGNHLLAATLTSAAAGSNCPATGTDPRCTTTVPVSDLVIDFTASAATVTPGGTLTYTATITNAGQTPYYGISVSTGTVALAANVTSDGNITTTSGTLFDRRGRHRLDRGHPHRRHRHHHLPRPGRQPRHQHHPDRHRRIGRTRQQLPGHLHRPPLHPHHPGAVPGPDDHQDRLGEQHHARLDGELHHYRGRHRPHPLHRRQHHRSAQRRA